MKSSLVFWFWNDKLDADTIRQQIDDMHRKNVDGFFIHTMPEEFRPQHFAGGMPGYLSEYYFEMFAVALERTRELGMELWLYDEGGWPSGSCNGTIPEARPDLRMHRIESSGEIIEIPNRPDLLNPEATGLFIASVHEKYRERFSADFGKTIPGIFTDEPFFGTYTAGEALPWSPVLAERFAAEKNYDARDAAMRILHHNDPQARRDYFGVWSALICENFMMPIQKWCRENNLLFTGHFNGDDTIENLTKFRGADTFAPLSYFDVPGCDVIWRQIHPLEAETDFPRLTVAAAGNKPVISESFAVYGADLSLAEMKLTAAMQFVAGVNIVAPMAAHYSNRGGRQVSTVSNFFGVDPRWDFYGEFSNFLHRMAAVLNRAEPVYKAVVRYPLEELQSGTYTGNLFAEGLALAEKQLTYTYAAEAVPFSGEADITTDAPCPALRTRHLRSPRGERRIFVNSGLTGLECTFTAPQGYNVWFDPSSGKRSAATEVNGKLSLSLPFAGVMVLLTLPGKKAAAQPACRSEKLPLTWQFVRAVKAFRATENGLVESAPPENPGENFCGTLRYETSIDLPAAAAAAVVLPEALRTMCELRLNGQNCGVRLWGPYRWDVTLNPGKNILTLDITDTPEKAIYDPDHVAMLERTGYINDYFRKCLQFTPLFPDEDPLQNAYMCIKK